MSDIPTILETKDLNWNVLTKKFQADLDFCLNRSIHVWVANLDVPQELLVNYIQFLDEVEKVKIGKFRLIKFRNRQIVSTGLLKFLLSRYLDTEPGNIKFRHNEFGKPFIIDSLNRDGIYFNISHSENLVVLAFVKDHAIGVDIEKNNILEDLDLLVDICFSDSEKQWFYQTPEKIRLDSFYKIWTIKEAYIKAIGKGFSFLPENISIKPEGSEMVIDTINGDNNIDRWAYKTFKLNSDYTSTVLVENFKTRIDFFHFDSSEIKQFN